MTKHHNSRIRDDRVKQHNPSSNYQLSPTQLKRRWLAEQKAKKQAE